MEANALEPTEVIMIIPLTPLRLLRYVAQQYPSQTAVVWRHEQRFIYAQFSRIALSRQAGALLSLAPSSLASAWHFSAPIVTGCWRDTMA